MNNELKKFVIAGAALIATTFCRAQDAKTNAADTTAITPVTMIKPAPKPTPIEHVEHGDMLYEMALEYMREQTENRLIPKEIRDKQNRFLENIERMHKKKLKAKGATVIDSLKR